MKVDDSLIIIISKKPIKKLIFNFTSLFIYATLEGFETILSKRQSSSRLKLPDYPSTAAGICYDHIPP